MNTSSFLRILVALELILIIVGIPSMILLHTLLPEELQNWDAEQEINTFELFLFPLLLLLLFTALIADIALLCLQKWGAWLYLSLTVLGILMTPFLGPTVQHALVTTLDEMIMINQGLIIGIAFFTDALSPKGNPAEPIPPGV